MYDYFFIFVTPKNQKPLGFVHQYKDAIIHLSEWIDQNEKHFLTIQKTCQNKLPITIHEYISQEDKLSNALHTDKELATQLEPVDLTDNLDEFLNKIHTTLQQNPFPILSEPSLAMQINHIVLNIYHNGYAVHNVVRNQDVISNFLYNTNNRFGRIIYLDGVRMYNGCIKPTALADYDKMAEKWFQEVSIDRMIPTIPYK